MYLYTYCKSEEEALKLLNNSKQMIASGKPKFNIFPFDGDSKSVRTAYMKAWKKIHDPFGWLQFHAPCRYLLLMRLFTLVVIASILTRMDCRDSITCQGSAFEKRGFFCYDQKRDVDMLVDSFLELGLDAEAMIASKPKIIRKLFPPPVVPTTTTTTTTTPRVTSTTTTTPPMRRRVAAGWPASGAQPCEDYNPSDAADTDCYADRYATFKDDFYSKLQTMSEAVQTTSTYADKLGTFINSVKIPAFQQSLAFTLNDSLTILNQSTIDAFADIRNAITNSRNDTTTNISALDTRSVSVQAALRTRIQTQFSSFNNVSLANINALIKRANDVNNKNGAVAYARDLTFTNGNGTVKITNDEATMQSALNRLSLLHSTVSTNAFYTESNLSSVRLPLALSQNNNWVTSKQSTFNSTLGTLINRTISLNNISSVVTQTDNGIKSVLDTATTAISNSVAEKTTRANAAIANINAFIKQMSDGITSNYNRLTTGLKQVQSNVENGTFSTYARQQAAVDNIRSNLSTYGVDYIANWETGANAKLTRMKGLVAGFASALASNASSATANGTSGLQSTVLSSLAAAGNVQNEINAQMIARQAAALAAMQSLMSKSKGNAASFSQLFANVTSAMTSLEAAARAGEPLDMFSVIVGALDRLAMNVTATAQDAQDGVVKATMNRTSMLDKYEASIAEWWKNKLSAGSAEDLDRNITNFDEKESRKLDNISSIFEREKSSFEGSTSMALRDIQTAQNQLFASAQKTQQIIVNALNFVSLQAAAGLQNFTRAMDSVKNDLSSLQFATSGDPDSSTAMNAFKVGLVVSSGTRADLNNAIRSVRMQLQSGVDSFARNVKSSIREPAAALLELMRKSSSGSLQAATGLSIAIANSERLLNQSLTALNDSMNNLLSSELRLSVGSGIDELFVTKNGLGKEVREMESRVSSGSAAVKTANATLSTIMNNLAFMNSTVNSSGLAAINMVTAVINAAVNINAILGEEISSLADGVVDASLDVNKTIADLSSMVNSSKIVSKWYAESNASFVSAWTGQKFNAIKNQLDDAVEAGNDEILMRKNTTRSLEDSAMKSAISVYSTNITSLADKLNQSALSQSSLSSQFMTGMNQTLTQLVSGLKTGNATTASSQLTQLQTVLNTVAGSVGAATGSVSSRVLSSSEDALGAILGSSSTASSNFHTLQQSATSTLGSASQAVSSGVSSVEAIDNILASSEKERENAAASVVNQIAALGDEMNGLLGRAVKQAIQSVTSPQGIDGSLTSIPAFLQAMGGQLVAWDSYATDKIERIEKFHKESSDGLEGEKAEMVEGLNGAANSVLEGTLSLGSIFGKISQYQGDLDDRLYRMETLENRINDLLVKPALSPNLTASGVKALGLSENQISTLAAAQTTAMRQTEDDVQAMIDTAGKAKLLFAGMEEGQES